jgi:hypothetical protein
MILMIEWTWDTTRNLNKLLTIYSHSNIIENKISIIFSHKCHMWLQILLVTLDKSRIILIVKHITWHQIEMIVTSMYNLHTLFI